MIETPPRKARRVMKWGEKLIRTTPNAQEFQLYGRNVHYLGGRATEVLGYRPAVTMQEGVALSAAWLRHLRFVG